MKMKVSNFAIPDMGDDSYYSSCVNSHWHDARMWNDNKTVPIFMHNDTGLVIKNEKFFDRTSVQIHIYPTDGKVVIINTRTGRCGIAKCHSDECFSESVGIAIAWARYCKEKIPDYVLK